MKQKLLLTLLIAASVGSVTAQKNTAFAITGGTKGSSAWNEVRLINMLTGEEQKTIYKSGSDIEILNARTGKAVVKKDQSGNSEKKEVSVIEVDKKLSPNNYEIKKITDASGSVQIIIRDIKTKVRTDVNTNVNTNVNTTTHYRYVYMRETQSTDKPFATKSAAMAYDKKHERLYYTPMGINQLRYIDMKSKTAKIYYFEDEAFGVVRGSGDMSNQITRMVIASDGNGYALTNDANHLIKFTTKKNPVITDLGAVSDDAANGRYSIHSGSVHGGDLIADTKGSLYLIGANRSVFKIDLNAKVATFKGSIQGLPRGFSTNGAVVEEGTKVIVASANSTEGYYRFDIKTMQAERLENSGSVFSASDLANGNLISEKKKKNNDEVVEQPVLDPDPQVENAVKPPLSDVMEQNKIAIYPNPASASSVIKMSFRDYKAGKYQVQLLDISGKVYKSTQVNINAKLHVADLNLPTQMAKGNYLVKILDESSKQVSITKLVVQ